LGLVGNSNWQARKHTEKHFQRQAAPYDTNLLFPPNQRSESGMKSKNQNLERSLKNTLALKIRNNFGTLQNDLQKLQSNTEELMKTIEDGRE
jgi:hypothetical protein